MGPLVTWCVLSVHSQGVLRKVTTFGAGLLIGTALIVIIPEGMESLFGESKKHGNVKCREVTEEW